MELIQRRERPRHPRAGGGDGYCPGQRRATGISNSSRAASWVATLEADLAVTLLLRSTVPAHIEILGGECGLPALRPFNVNLYMRTSNNNTVQQELADYIRDQFQRRFAAQPVRRAG